MYKKARLHFKKYDPKLHAAALEFKIDNVTSSKDLFRDVVWTIIGQQLSGKAADTIFERFEAYFTAKLITPRKILKLSEESMRKAGLSGAKARAIRDLSQKILSKEVILEDIPHMTDEEVLQELTKVKGIGPWTAEMVMMFSLGRTDIFSMGDLVLRKELMNLYGFKKMPSEKKLDSILASWSPYKTYAARILWKLGDRKKKTIRKKYQDLDK